VASGKGVILMRSGNLEDCVAYRKLFDDVANALFTEGVYSKGCLCEDRSTKLHVDLSYCRLHGFLLAAA